MKQLEIQFFWPLTEQIPLDLDYSACTIKSPDSFVPVTGLSNLTFSGTFNNDNVTIQTQKEIGWLGRKLYKIMGLEWKKTS